MNDPLTVNFATDINVGHKGGKKMNDLSVKYQNDTDIQPSLLYRDFQEANNE